MLPLMLVELLGFEFLSRLLFCFFISLFLLSELFLESPVVSVLKELERFVLKHTIYFSVLNTLLSFLTFPRPLSVKLKEDPEF